MGEEEEEEEEDKKKFKQGQKGMELTLGINSGINHNLLIYYPI